MLYTPNCIDSETTSSVESQNSIVKEKLGISRKMDIHKDIEKIRENTNCTIQQQKEAALHLLNQVNMSSKSATIDFIIPKSQAIADSETRVDMDTAWQRWARRSCDVGILM